MKLNELQIGSTATILSVGGEGALRQHFLDMGLIQGTEVTVVQYAPMGDPIELRLHGYELTIRLKDAKNIEISKEHKPKNIRKKVEKQEKLHPGYGEGGKFHNRKEETPLPEGETLTFALVGNQNCGKTTLFNQLTGSKQHVGNFPGVTVDRKDGVIKGHNNTLITDLPGIYSMSPYSSEEIVTREFVIREKPKGIINIVDATNIERNLYLTMQLLELGFPMVVALNMMDELRENGGSVLVNEMEEALGVPVIPISAAKAEGIEELIQHAIHVAKYQEKPLETDFCRKEEGVHRGIHAAGLYRPERHERALLRAHDGAGKLHRRVHRRAVCRRAREGRAHGRLPANYRPRPPADTADGQHRGHHSGQQRLPQVHQHEEAGRLPRAHSRFARRPRRSLLLFARRQRARAQQLQYQDHIQHHLQLRDHLQREHLLPRGEQVCGHHHRGQPARQAGQRQGARRHTEPSQPPGER